MAFMRDNAKKVKAKEKEELIAEEIKKQEAIAPPKKRKKGEPLKFKNQEQAGAYIDKMMERRGPAEHMKYWEDISKGREETEGIIEETIDSTIYGRPPKNKKYKKGGLLKKRFGGMAIKGVKTDVPIY